MSDTSPIPSRREFLTGRAVQQQVEHAGEQFADALIEAGEHRPVPVAHDTVRLETSAMACQWAVVMNPGSPRQVMVASNALDVVHALEEQLTVYRDDSELMRINREAAHADQPVEERLFDLLLQCRRWSEETAGAFDPTSGPLIRLWRDCRAAGRIPTVHEVVESMNRVGICRVRFDTTARSVRFPIEGFFFDFGAVGKGYAIDRAAEHLRLEGVDNFLIHGGHSSLYAAGDHTGHEGWPVGIKNPLFTSERYATLLLKDRGMSTSGSNLQYYRHQGKRYGHILDPRTGWPAHSPDGEIPPAALSSRSAATAVDALLSVTVLAPTAAEADALSTAFYVMGLEKAGRYCHNHAEVSAILIPAPARGRTLQPVICNLVEDNVFFEPSVVRSPLSAAAGTSPSNGPRTTDNGPTP